MDKINLNLTKKEARYLQVDDWLYAEWEYMVKWVKKCNDEFVPLLDHAEELEEKYPTMRRPRWR